ncbi:MAG: hypothetical protein AB7F86_04460 [Bdellovibrionales bacterium]
MRLDLAIPVFLLASLSWKASAADTVRALDFTIHQEYVSTRALGMGNAYTAVADDHSSMFYNPATLAFRKDGHLRMFLRAGATPESWTLFNEIKDKSDVAENEQPQAYSDLIVSHYGDHFYYRIPTIGAIWVRPGWGIALIPADLSLDVAVHRQIGPALNVNLYEDTTLAFSYAHKLHWFNKRHQLSWGATLKGIYRIHVAEAVSAGMLAQGQDVFSLDHAGEGLTGDIDIGTFWKPPVPRKGFFRFLKYMEPSFAIVGRNLADYGFKKNFHFIDKNSGEPAKLQRRIDFGSKWDLPRFWVFEPKMAFDVRDVLHDNWTWKKGMHAGFEAYWRMFNWWKGHWSAGLNQGYWTAGFGARLAWFQLDLCSYGEDVGTSSEPLESRRYMAELALDF